MGKNFTKIPLEKASYKRPFSIDKTQILGVKNDLINTLMPKSWWLKNQQRHLFFVESSM